MKPLSADTSALLEQLEAAHAGGRSKPGGGPSPTLASLPAIVAAGELEAAVAMVTIAMGANEPARTALFNAVDHLVRSATPTDLAWLSQRRHAWYGRWSARPVNAQLASLTPNLPVSAVGIASFSPSGYVREDAVKQLAASADPLASAFLLLRLNDWVARVASLARAAVDARLEDPDLRPLVPWLEMVLRLVDAHRRDFGAFIDRFQATFAEPRHADALFLGCAARSVLVRRWCVVLALQSKVVDLRGLLRQMLADADRRIRSMAADRVGAHFAPDELRLLLREMLHSSTPAVRATALDALGSTGGAQARADIASALFDRNPLVRSAARTLLAKLPDFDIAASYRAAIADDAVVSPGAIEGMGEVGGAADATRLIRFLANDRPRVRSAALAAIAKLDPASHREAFIAALEDASPRVCRASRELLLRQVPVDAAHLLDLALRGGFLHTCRAALVLARAHDHWACGLLILQIVQRGDPELAATAQAALERWLTKVNRTFTAPTGDQFAELEVRAGSLRDPTLRSRLRELMPAIALRMR